MDSMRSLNTSLPTSSGRPALEKPPEQLLQAFKNAALSVTNLYKQAAVDHSSARQAGFQDALDELLGFLDKENLGLDGGEGWKVRQWATERFDRVNCGANVPESDDDRIERDTRRSGSPPVPSGQMDANTIERQTSRSSSPPPAESAPTAELSSRNAQTDPTSHDTSPKPPMFTFRSTPQPTSDSDMINSEPAPTHNQAPPESSNSPSFRLEVINRGNRSTNRQGGYSRHGTRGTTTREVVPLGGTKRKLQLSEYFDISNFGSWRDGPNGAKRGRFT
ncbi:MAG: hypothetical protein Q9160_004571 [Pyrenula sp. 1 TL-2023]